MLNAVLRYAVPIIALFVLGPMAASRVAALRTFATGEETTLLSAGVLPGLLALVAVAGLALLAGLIGSTLLGRDAGLGAAGLVAAWSAMRTGDMALIHLQAGGAGLAFSSAFEGALLAVVGVAVVRAVERTARDGGEAPGLSERSLRQDLAQPAALLLPLALGVVVTLAASFLVARSGLRGQGLMSGVLAGIAGGAAAHLGGWFFGKPVGVRTSALAVLAAAPLAPLVGLVVPGAGELASAARTGTLTGPALLQPLDLLAGGLIGGPMGWRWAASTMHSAAAATPQRA